MRTIFYPAAAILAAYVSAERGDPLPEGFEVDTAEPIGSDSHCCYLYGHADYEYDPLSVNEEEGYDRNYSKKRFCLSMNHWSETKITPFSFYDVEAESGGAIQDNLESYKCGENVAMEVCSETYLVQQVQSERYGTFNKYQCVDNGTLSIAAPGDRVTYYYQRENLASSIILYPIAKPDCVVLYSMYDLPNCEGNQFTVSRSYNNRDEMNSAFPERFKENGETTTIRSIKHPARSRVTIWENADFTGGAWQTENVSTIEERPDFVCSTFRFDRAQPTDIEPGDGLDLDWHMDQGSIEWWYEDCDDPIVDLGAPNGVYFWVTSDKWKAQYTAEEIAAVLAE